MDAGANGVVVPMVNSADEAQSAVSAIYYPGRGRRGVGLSRAQGYGVDFSGYKEWAEKNTVLIVQIEHIKAVENLEEILAVEGVDGFIVGPYDLSGSLGLPGKFDHPSVIIALERVARIMKERNAVGGYHVVHSNRRALLEKIDEGFKFIAYGDDMIFLAEKIRDEMGNVRAAREGDAG
jgi:2-dehydro-3-deoxyglucarate aldolase